MSTRSNCATGIVSLPQHRRRASVRPLRRHPESPTTKETGECSVEGARRAADVRDFPVDVGRLAQLPGVRVLAVSHGLF
jgi:hypothetical protein